MKKKKLILGFLICIMAISIFLIGNYDNRSYKENNKKDKSSFDSELALILIEEDESGNDVETKVDTYPSASEYYLDFAKSNCNNGSIIGWDNVNNKVKITATKGDKCTLYFRKGTDAVNLKTDVLARNTLVTTTPDFSVAATDTNANIYQAADDYGDSYYFRGASTNNYVKFGEYEKETTLTLYDYDEKVETDVTIPAGTPMYWRIVRINGDGTIRMVYDGTSLSENGVKHHCGVAISNYNTHGTETKYLGYTYDVDGVQTDSLIKAEVDSWYKTNLETSHSAFIADRIFCNDLNDGDGDLYFDPSERLEDSKSPILTCTNSMDRYTKNSYEGNGLLSNPIGLLTADEVMMAGGRSINTSYYLYSGEDYWLMTPYSNASGYPYIGIVTTDGTLMNTIISNVSTASVRPVINLNADLLFTGTGKVDDPYKIAGFE